MKYFTKTSNDLKRILWRFLPVLLCVTVVILFIALAIAISRKSARLEKEKAMAEQAAMAVISVVTQTMKPLTMHDRIDLPAVVEAWEDLTVKAEVVGKVVAVHVREGEHVAKGQPLLLIDKRDYINQLTSIAAQRQLAEANFKRLQSLIEQGAVSLADFDKAQAALNELTAAQKSAELNLERCTIKTPIAGTVNDLPAKLGVLLAHGDPVAQILDIGRLKVEVAIPEAEVNAVRKIDSCKIIFTALNNYTVTGEKYFLARKPLTSSMVYTLRLALQNPDEKILPGMFARVDIIKETVQNAFGVPLFSVITRNDEQYVFVVENGIARKRYVKTGFLEGWKVRISSGLQENDQVVVVGHRNLEDGQKVKLIRSVSDPGEISQ